jgi:hypothetical protein
VSGHIVQRQTATSSSDYAQGPAADASTASVSESQAMNSIDLIFLQERRIGYVR